MSKINEELNELKKEVEAVNEKLHELTPEELEQVTGAGLAQRASVAKVTDPDDGKKDYSQKQWKDLLIDILKNK